MLHHSVLIFNHNVIHTHHQPQRLTIYELLFIWTNFFNVERIGLHLLQGCQVVHPKLRSPVELQDWWRTFDSR